jgi:hypothetical protein
MGTGEMHFERSASSSACLCCCRWARSPACSYSLRVTLPPIPQRLSTSLPCATRNKQRDGKGGDVATCNVFQNACCEVQPDVPLPCPRPKRAQVARCRQSVSCPRLSTCCTVCPCLIFPSPWGLHRLRVRKVGAINVFSLLVRPRKHVQQSHKSYPHVS